MILKLGFVKNLGSRMFENCKISSTDQHGGSSGTEQLHVTRRNIYFLKYNACSKIVTFCTDKECSNEIHNNVHFNSKLKTFVKKYIFSLIEDSDTQDQYITCYSHVIRDGITFRGYSPNSVVYPGWAMFQWIGSADGETVLCPGKILLFLDLTKVQFKRAYANQYRAPGLYTVIHSLEKTPVEVYKHGHISICNRGMLETCKFQYRIVSESTIYNSCFIVPNFGAKEGNSVLYIFPRIYNTSHDITDDGSGWASKF